MTIESARSRTIGAVIRELKGEFPDLSISKIRFLEAEGLLRPARTRSGYRTFSEDDVRRLRFILTAQRDRFWPLRVIREALERGTDPVTPLQRPSYAGVTGSSVADRAIPQPAGAEPAGAEPAPAGRGSGASRPTVRGPEPTGGDPARLTRRAFEEATGVDGRLVQALVAFGLVAPDREGRFGPEAVAVASAARELTAYGMEPRHLRPVIAAAEREADLVEHVLGPGRTHPRERAGRAADIAALLADLHAALVRDRLARTL